jgi:hypothetical protein
MRLMAAAIAWVSGQAEAKLALLATADQRACAAPGRAAGIADILALPWLAAAQYFA